MRAPPSPSPPWASPHPPRAQTAPDWTQRPAVGAAPRLELPPVERFTLSNGLTVLLMERHAVPVVQANLVVRAGSADDPAGREGLAALTADLLDEGAGSRTALELADAVEFLGASLATGASYHATTVALHTPAARLDSALALLADVALRPRFQSAELDRIRATRLTAFAQRRDQPNALAAVAVDRALYGDGHPYGRPVAGTPAALGALAPDVLAAFYRARFRPGNAALVVVGDVTAAALRPRLEALFGAWESVPVAPARVAEGRQVARRTVLLVDKPGAAQSAIRIARIGAPRSADDYVALNVLNTILGGSFTSRLNQNLRERNGYAYGASSSFAFRPVAGPFVAAANVQTASTAEAITEFFNELRGLLRPVPADELAKAKSNLALSFPEPFASVRGTASVLADLYLYDLPADYLATYTDRVRAVTAADLARVARRYVDPERVAVVVVGDRALVEAKMRALNLGPFTVQSADDVLGPARPAGD